MSPAEYPDRDWPIACAQADLLVMAEVFEALAVAVDTGRVMIQAAWMRWFGEQIQKVSEALDAAEDGA